jgi:hypothetical protein
MRDRGKELQPGETPGVLILFFAYTSQTRTVSYSYNHTRTLEPFFVCVAKETREGEGDISAVFGDFLRTEERITYFFHERVLENRNARSSV